MDPPGFCVMGWTPPSLTRENKKGGEVIVKGKATGLMRTIPSPRLVLADDSDLVKGADQFEREILQLADCGGQAGGNESSVFVFVSVVAVINQK